MELIQINPDGKKLPEYSDYLKNPSKENASELLSELLEQSADMIADKEILVKYVAERPGVEKIGKHGLFSDGDDEIILSQAQKKYCRASGECLVACYILNPRGRGTTRVYHSRDMAQSDHAAYR